MDDQAADGGLIEAFDPHDGWSGTGARGSDVSTGAAELIPSRGENMNFQAIRDGHALGGDLQPVPLFGSSHLWPRLFPERRGDFA
jgi:hypothetical protein